MGKQTGLEVAIKQYKVRKDKPKDAKVCLMKFKRQIDVLKNMQKPLEKSACDNRHWHKELEGLDVKTVFIQLIDYSKEADGSPGNDPKDGVSYVVTELAEYSMKDYLADRRETNRP